MKNILVCTDGSPYAHVCCQYAAWFAKRSKAHLHILYASELNPLQNPLWADLGGSLGIDPFLDFSSKLEEIEKEKVKIIQKGIEDTLKTSKLPKTQFTFHHHFNQLTDAVQDFEESKKRIDFIFLGKRGENATLEKDHLGSSLERVVRGSSKPCLVTSRAFKPIKSIALAVDDSPSIQEAIKFLKKSTSFKGCSIHVLSVDESKKENRAGARVDAAHQALKGSYKSIATKRLIGPIETKISNYISRHKVDMLVMGAYGHSRIRNLLIGSTTTLLIQSCKVPVLLFR